MSEIEIQGSANRTQNAREYFVVVDEPLNHWEKLLEGDERSNEQ